MNFTFDLNSREVEVKEVLFKDIRNLTLYSDSTLRGNIEFLEQFIISKNLNIAEKFKAYMILREKCVGENISVGSNKGNINVSLDYINKNVGSFDEIETTEQVDNLSVTFDYPYEFNLGNTDFIFSCIKKLKMDDQTIDMQSLEKEERQDILNKLPKNVFHLLEKFINKNESKFKFNVIQERPSLDIKKIDLNLLNPSTPMFIYNIFNCMSDSDYREIIFVLSKRIGDVSFLLNCNYFEIEDYYSLYKDEVEKENENLQNQNNR